LVPIFVNLRIIHNSHFKNVACDYCRLHKLWYSTNIQLKNKIVALDKSFCRMQKCKLPIRQRPAWTGGYDMLSSS